MQNISAQVKLPFAEFTLDVDLQLPGRGVTVLFGHSGSGKTSLLRCIAGLEQAPSANIYFNGECWQSADTFVPIHKRDIGYVFQEASLFAHLSAMENLQYAIKRAPRTEQPQKQKIIQFRKF